MGRTPLAEDYYYEYDLLCRLLEEGRTPDVTAAPPSPPSGPSQPCTRRHRRIPAWASAMRGFSNGLGLAIFVFVAAPLVTRSANKEEVLFSILLLAMSFVFPALGYIFTWDLPEQT